MSDTSDYIDTIISNAIATASEYTDKVSDAADELMSETAGAWIDLPSTDADFDVSAVEPTIPDTDDLLLIYEANLEKIIALLSTQLASFFEKYYPLSSDAFDDSQAWLIDTITNGGTGINADVEAQVWQRSRERIVADTKRVKAGIATGYEAKAYTLASGSMLRKMEEADYEGLGRSGEASTTIAAKQIEIEIETVKFAIGKAIESRQIGLQAAADYIKAIATAVGDATTIAETIASAKAKMMTAAASWYGARLDRDKIILSSKLAEVDSNVDIYKLRKTNATDNSKVDVDALTAAADAYARTASATLSSLNTVVSEATNAFE
jgi:hypothetical protein